VPYALGQTVSFEEHHGPVLGVFAGTDSLEKDKEQWRKKLAPVYQAMGATRAALGADKALIGFGGAPWTLAAYMLEGKTSPDQRAAKLFAYRNPGAFTKLLEVLAEAVAWHLICQFEAGAGVVQIFDSWAGGLPEKEFNDWVVTPNKQVVALVRKQLPQAPIIGFPRAATQTGYEKYVSEVGVNAISVDTALSMRWAAARLGRRVAVQGNLDPVALIAGGEALDASVDRILADMKGTSFIFNLGHGVLPETPVEHVARVVERVRRPA
jgi:uroporphyrinogen decarboxylase